MDELEQVLGIRAYPMNWPIGMGPEFRGVYDRQSKERARVRRRGVARRERGRGALGLDRLREEIEQVLTERELAQLREDIELLDIGGDQFSREKSDARADHPDVLRLRDDELRRRARSSTRSSSSRRRPRRGSRTSASGAPTEPKFAGFVFKIQANMDPAHRDRIAFLRVVSGRFTKGMSVHHSRLGKDVRLAKPSQFMAAERTAIEEAWPGDVIGLFDPGCSASATPSSDGTRASSSRACRASRPSTSRSSARRTRSRASRWRRGSSSSPKRARSRSSSSSRWG